MVHKIWHASDFVVIFSKGHNSRKGDNSDKKKKGCQLFFHEESIYEISKPYHAQFLMNGSMDGQPETNMLPQLLRSWQHKYKNYIENSA